MQEDALPLREQLNFEALALAEVARRGLLAAETWQCNRPHISLKTTIDVPLLGTVIEQNGDGLLEDSLMPVGWPLHLDGAVKQRCVHRTTTLQELNDLLSAYDMKRDLVELNYKAAQWSHRAVWNQWYMEPKRGHHLSQLWADHATDITNKVTNSTEVTLDDMRRAAAAAANKPTAQLPDSVQGRPVPRLQKVCRFQGPKMNPLNMARCCSESNRKISKCGNTFPLHCQILKVQKGNFFSVGNRTYILSYSHFRKLHVCTLFFLYLVFANGCKNRTCSYTHFQHSQVK